jgi:GNAT superfamily N-acetyltransferase
MLNVRELLKTKGIPELWGELTWLRCRELEGTLDRGPGYGCWGITDLRIRFGIGTPRKPQFDHLRQGEWPPELPPMDEAAGRDNRIAAYRRVRSAAECAGFIDKHLPVNAGFTITADWLAEETCQTGIIPAAPKFPPIGAHAVHLFGVDHVKRLFEFDNLFWGEGWGEQGFGWMPFRAFDEQLIEAYTLDGPGASLAGRSGVVWGSSLGYHLSPHGMVVFNTPDDLIRFGWAMFTEDDSFIHVDDLYVRPEFRGAGWGRKILEKLIEVALTYDKQLRLWIPFADCEPESLARLTGFFGRHGLVITPSPERWAGCVAQMAWLPAPAPRVKQPERPSLAADDAKRAADKYFAQKAESSDAEYSPAVDVGNPEWARVTERRAELIYKKNRGGLEPREKDEFDRLQRISRAAVGRAFSPPPTEAGGLAGIPSEGASGR